MQAVLPNHAEPFARQTSAISAKSACRNERKRSVYSKVGGLFLTQMAQMTQIYHAGEMMKKFNDEII